MEKTYLTTNKFDGKWSCNSLISSEGDCSCCGLTWPPKYYTCSFCKREFRSAQALGGHMNVHRKDRARLRLLSSWVLECQNPKPNSNPNPSSSPSNFISSPSAVNYSLYPHHSLLSPLPISTPSCLLPEKRGKPLIPQLGDLSKEKTMTPFLGVEKLKRHAQKYDQLEVGENTGLELERGFKDSKEVLDLELRLGYF
ncbi:hypothetical protein DITRI_Ditri13aG0100500 [Diplodiscus trichospermus]